MVKKQIIKNTVLCSLILAIAACSSRQSQPFNTKTRPLTPIELNNRESLVETYNQWKGTPYLYGGQTRQGVDCSALVQTFFKQNFAYNLPRTTKTQSQAGRSITPFDEKKVGDLLFFQITKKNQHVGIYIGHLQFVHASQSKGVIISRLDNPYWGSRLWQVRRVPIPTKTAQ